VVAGVRLPEATHPLTLVVVLPRRRPPLDLLLSEKKHPTVRMPVLPRHHLSLDLPSPKKKPPMVLAMVRAFSHPKHPRHAAASPKSFPLQSPVGDVVRSVRTAEKV
jgi:hypothetical protein